MLRAPSAFALFLLLWAHTSVLANPEPTNQRRPRVEPWQTAAKAKPGECKKAEASLPATLQELRASEGRPTPALLRRATGEVGFFARLCLQNDKELHSLLLQTWEAAGPRLQRRFLAPEFLLRIQPPGLTTERPDGERHLLMRVSLQRRAKSIDAAARDASCRPGTFQEFVLPQTADCFADWLHWRVVLVDRAYLDPKETNRFLSESLARLRRGLADRAKPVTHLPFSWTLHAPTSTFRGPSPLAASKPAITLLLGEGDSQARVHLLVASADHLPTFFPIGYTTPRQVTCERANALAHALAESVAQGMRAHASGSPASPAPAHSVPEGASARAAVFLSRAVLDVCTVAQRTEPLAQLRTVLKQDPHLKSPSSDVDGLSLLNAAETDSRADLLLRDLLGLRIQLGSPYDLEDLEGAPPSAGVEFVRDNILADSVRRVRPEWPWMHLAESVEDSEHQEKRLALVWDLLTRSKAPDTNALKLQQLETDLLAPFTLTPDERKNLIDRLRAISSTGKAEIPALFPLGFRIHNSASPVLVDAVQAYPNALGEEKLKTDARPFLVGLGKQLVELYGLRPPNAQEVGALLERAGPPLGDTERKAIETSEAFLVAAPRLVTLLKKPLPTDAAKRLDHWKALRVLWAVVKASPECTAQNPSVNPENQPLSDEKTKAKAELESVLGMGSAEAWAERASRLHLFLATHAARKSVLADLRHVRAERLKAFEDAFSSGVYLTAQKHCIPRPPG